MKTTKIDKQLLKALRVEITAALKLVADKYGIKLDAGHCSFTDMTAIFKLNMALISPDGTVLSAERERFTRYAELIGLKTSNLDAEISVGSFYYSIVGLKANIDGKYPIVCRRSDGKTFLLPTTTVKAALGASVATI